MSKNLFQLPTAPEQFSVLLPPAELRKIDYSALEFQTARKAVVEYIKTYFPNEFNDFVANNGIIMLIELISYLTAVLSLRADILANEAFLPTARTEDAVTNHLALINQKIRRATPATIDIECSVDAPLNSDIHIKPGLSPFEVRGDDGRPISYELYAAPGDIISDIIIPAGKRGVIGFAIEGKTKEATLLSDGKPNQQLSIADRTILDDPIRINVQVGVNKEEWSRIDNIERAKANDKVFEARIFENRMMLVFGDNIAGRIPPIGANVDITYRTGGGKRGRIGAGVINTQRPLVPEYPYTAPVPVQFRNLNASIGGVDAETIDEAKKRAPRDFSVQNAAITESDYAQLANSFVHPAFGTISKAVATVRTGLNANLVEVYVLAEGADGRPQKPNEGLRRALGTYLDEINVITDKVVVKDGCIRPVDLQMTVIMSRNADATIVKTKVEQAVNSFFAISNWDMGEPLYVSQLYEVINQIDGVAYTDIFNPVDNVLPTGELCLDDSTPTKGVGINEVITLGSRDITYYYEASR